MKDQWAKAKEEAIMTMGEEKTSPEMPDMKDEKCKMCMMQKMADMMKMMEK